MSKNFAFEILSRHDQVVDLGLLHITNMLRRDTPPFLDNQFATELDVENRSFTAQTLRYEAHADVLRRQVKIVGLEEDVQHLFIVEPKRPQNDRHRQFSAPVDACEYTVLRIKFEIQPRSPVRNDACRKQEFAGRMSLALVVIEENTRRTMQLRHDHALGTVYDEGAVVCHQRHFAEIDLLLTNVFYGLVRATCFLVIYDQAHFDANRRGESEAAHLTFLDVEYRRAKTIAHVLERSISRIADYRKYSLKRRMQPNVFAILFGRIGLQEFPI